MKRDTLSYHGYRFPPDIISHAVWLYHRFGVSFRDVEDLLAQRGITVSYEAIRLGTVKLSRICPFCGRILLDQRLRINDLAVAAGGENAAKLLNLTVPSSARASIRPSILTTSSGALFLRYAIGRLRAHRATNRRQ